MQSNPTKRAVVAVVCRDNHLLVIRRSESVVAPGAYCFPGGGIQAGESESNAIVREMREELSGDITPRHRLWQSVTPWKVQLAWWLVELQDGSVLTANPAEVAEILWLTREDVISLDGLLESNHHFFKALDRGEFRLNI